MKSSIDLHIHTTASDGDSTPTEVVKLAHLLNLTTVAVTDHDSVGGVDEALHAAEANGLEVIPGVEINSESADCSLHILGYYVDHHDATLLSELARLRGSRRERAHKVLEKLAGLGMPVDWERLTEIAGSGTLGRPHIAQAMLERGYVASIQEAFVEYLSRGCPAYVQRARLTPEESIALILSVGGIPVLAHPLGLTNELPRLIPAGLMGLEAYYSGYSLEDSRVLASQAREHDLLVTGGSDYHGPSILPEIQMGQVCIPHAILRKLRARHVAMADHD